MNADNKVMDIVVSWSGTKKNGKTALCTGDKETVKWFNFGRNCKQKPEYFVKGQKYRVLVGEDAHHILYINGIEGDTPTSAVPDDMGGDFPEELKAQMADFKGSSISTSTIGQNTPQNAPVCKVISQNEPVHSQNPKVMEIKELVGNRQIALLCASLVLNKNEGSTQTATDLADVFLRYLETK